MTCPTIPQAFTAKHAAFVRHTSFGHLLNSDRAALLRCVARPVWAPGCAKYVTY